MALAPATVQRMPPRLRRPHEVPAGTLDDAAADAQSCRAECGIVHAAAVAHEVGVPLAGLLAVAGVGADGAKQAVEVTGEVRRGAAAPRRCLVPQVSSRWQPAAG